MPNVPRHKTKRPTDRTRKSQVTVACSSRPIRPIPRLAGSPTRRAGGRGSRPSTSRTRRKARGRPPDGPAFVTRQEGRRESGHHREMKTGFERHGAILHERQLLRRSKGPRSPRRGAPAGPNASVFESNEGNTF